VNDNWCHGLQYVTRSFYSFKRTSNYYDLSDQYLEDNSFSLNWKAIENSFISDSSSFLEAKQSEMT